ncbi:MAG: alkaline phosphatase D family protein [Planctomycetaceae bacterium]
MGNLNRRTFGATVVGGITASAVGAEEKSGEPAVGPIVGHVSSSRAMIWYRPGIAGKYELRIRRPGQQNSDSFQAVSDPENDLCVIWKISDLKTATNYEYEILKDGKLISGGASQTFKTGPADDAKTKTSLAFGSCAESRPLKLWSQMAENDADGLILLGDTPYIDTTNLEVQRAKHREFLRIPELSEFGRSRPVWGTWDDHDFGRNDSDGKLPGKENSRKVFTEYRALASYGDGESGVYTKFRRAGAEVFLLDTRWFARTEPSPVDPEKPSLLGKKQWQWLLDGLKASDAPFKVIACGMIWDNKRNTESDDWSTYSHERQALFDFIGEQGISGVVLIGGDIHCSRWLQYKTEEQVGYPIRQFIVSPIHARVIPTLNVPHPDLIKGAAIPNVWLRLDVDTTAEDPTLHAHWIQMDGRQMWDVKLTESELTKK